MMVWINTQCSNRTAPDGTFGGAMCVCPKCTEERQQKARLAERYKNRTANNDDDIIMAGQDIEDSP